MNLYEIAEKIGVKGFLHCNELHALVELAANREVLEVGAFSGLSSWGMAITAKRVIAVDTFKANSAGQTQENQYTTLEDFKRNTSRFKNVMPFAMTSEEASRHIKTDFDMIFIDAMHDYESVKADITRWWPRVRHDGIMAFHDYGHSDWPGVKQAVDERFGPADGTQVVTLRWVARNMVA